MAVTLLRRLGALDLQKEALGFQTTSIGRRRGRRWLIFAGATVVAAFCLGAIASYDSLRWRAVIVFDKSVGRLGDVGWSDLLWMLRPGSGVYLERLSDKRNPFEVIESPRRTQSDFAAGERLFREHCSSCHGANARGGVGGPALPGHIFRQGRSDWALYRTITSGVPGTSMVGWQLPRDDVWRLVTYIDRTLGLGDAQSPSIHSTAARAKFAPVSADELEGAADDHPEDWLTYSGSFASHRHSRLNQINRGNVGTLRVEWARQFPTTEDRIETSPIIRGSTMFITEPPNRVHALDATSGQVLWTYTRDLPSRLQLCCGPANRGVALLGNRVFVGTLDAHLVALDAETGKLLWDVAVAAPSSGYSITGAPLAVKDMVITGVAGGEFMARGFVDAYDAASGKRRWRFYTVPAAGEAGSETWGDESPRPSGAPTWLTGSYDPEQRVIYWGVGNPSPEFYGEGRKGDNLYSDSVIALDHDTGRLRWYFQFTPHDLHDWDAVQIPVLVDTLIDNSKRKLLAFANRNGFYYLLDRMTGRFLLGRPFVRQNWADGLDANGRPLVRPESIPSRQGAIVYPGVTGATNWGSPTYDSELSLIFVPTIERGSIFYSLPELIAQHDGQVLGGGTSSVPGEQVITAVKALEVSTGQVRWKYARPPRESYAEMGGLMSTAGRLVFGGDLESVFALDEETGAELWHFSAGGRIAAAPVSYQVAGRQYVAVAAGRNILAFALPPSGVGAKGPSPSADPAGAVH